MTVSEPCRLRFDLFDDLLGNAEIFQPLPGSALCRQGPGVPHPEIGHKLSRRCRKDGAVHAHQGLAFAHMAAGRDVLQSIEEGIEAQGHDRLAMLVGLNHAGRADRGGEDTAGNLLRSHAGALQLSRREFDSRSAVILALIDGDVIHPHRILPGHRRYIRKPHGIAVIKDLPAVLRLGLLRLLEAGFLILINRDIVAPICRFSGLRREIVLAVRVLPIKDRSFSGRALNAGRPGSRSKVRQCWPCAGPITVAGNGAREDRRDGGPRKDALSHGLSPWP